MSVCCMGGVCGGGCLCVACVPFVVVDASAVCCVGGVCGCGLCVTRVMFMVVDVCVLCVGLLKQIVSVCCIGSVCGGGYECVAWVVFVGVYIFESRGWCLLWWLW